MIDESDVQYREQLNGEWLALASTREVLKLAKGNASYKEALNFGADIMPEILGEDSLLRKNQMSPEARYWTQKANGQRQSGAVVTPQQLIKRR